MVALSNKLGNTQNRQQNNLTCVTGIIQEIVFDVLFMWWLLSISTYITNIFFWYWNCISVHNQSAVLYLKTMDIPYGAHVTVNCACYVDCHLRFSVTETEAPLFDVLDGKSVLSSMHTFIERTEILTVVWTESQFLVTTSSQLIAIKRRCVIRRNTLWISPFLNRPTCDYVLLHKL